MVSETKDSEELFDTLNDPLELNNISADPRYASKLTELRAELEKWMRQTKDKGFIPEKEWVASIWPGMIQPQTIQPVVSSQQGSITLKSETPGASMSYKVAKDPLSFTGEKWKLYVGPIKIKPGETIIALAERIGYKSSESTRFTLKN